MKPIILSLPVSSCSQSTGPASRRLGGGWLSGLALGLALVVITGCQSPQYSGLPSDAMTPPPASQLKEGDIIQIVFPGATNLNAVHKIPLDGTVKLAFAGEVQAVGKTTAEMEAAVLQAYGDQLQLKEVSVMLAASSATIYVSGAVLRPGRIPMERPLTVMEAIMESGGFDPNRAKLSEVIVIRTVEGHQVNYRVNLKKALRGLDPVLFYLKPFDIVHVPTKTFNL